MSRNLFLGIAAAMIFLSAAAYSAGLADEHGSCPAWSYSGDNGPAHWGDLCPDYAMCKTGKSQAPLDIVNPQQADLPPIHLNSRPAPLNLVNNGHTIRQDFAPGNGNVLIIGDKKYELQQFHFHHPSEETLDGKHWAMTAHLVYTNGEGNIAVLTIEVKEGRPNQLISLLWSHLPKEMNTPNNTSAIEVNTIQLVPAKLSYYQYKGSLTIPPCPEGLTFLVLDTPMEFSKTQIEKFAQLYPDNARPTQPLNGRMVLRRK